MYTPEPDEVVIKIHAVAMNPMEAMVQRFGIILEEFPAILGSDGAGTIHAIGSNVKGFSLGDRVMACFDGVPPFHKAYYRKVSFQNYAVARSNFTASSWRYCPSVRCRHYHFALQLRRMVFLQPMVWSLTDLDPLQTQIQVQTPLSGEAAPELALLLSSFWYQLAMK